MTARPCTCPTSRWSARFGDHAAECPSYEARPNPSALPLPASPEAQDHLLAAAKWAERQLRALVTEDDGSGAFGTGFRGEIAGFGQGMDDLRAAIRKASGSSGHPSSTRGEEGKE